VVDPAGCADAGTPAFTEGGVTHFASASPDLHVAAHEAAHQLQQSGVARDAGLGAEGHAGAVADSVVAGTPVGGLVGSAGAAVPAGRYNYTDADGNANWKGVSPGAVFTRLADTGETWTRGTHEAYATAALITQANDALGKQKSGVSLAAGGGEKVVDAPDGSGQKSLSKLQVTVAGAADQSMPADCRQSAREVMGLGKGEREAATVRLGDQQTVVEPDKTPLDTVAETIFIEQRVRETPNYATLTGDEQRQTIAKAKADFAGLSREDKDKLKKSPIAEETARKMGIDTAAQPGVGEAFSIFRADRAPMGQYDFHYATVIMVAGSDRVTMENAGGDQGHRDQHWKIETYGPASKQQSFHDDWSKTFGANAHTVTSREAAARTPADAAAYPAMTTAELITRLEASKDSDEAQAIEGELRKRQILVDVTVDATEDDYFGDEVFVKARSGGQSRETSYLTIKAGLTKTLEPVSVASLLPLAAGVSIDVIEWDLIGNDLIGTIDWPLPLLDKSGVALSYKTARYRVNVRTATAK
jgi:hypothetical protein